MVFIIGCTGTQIKVTPIPQSVYSYYLQPPYEKIGVNSIKTSDSTITDGFASALKETGFAKTVFYPMRSDDKTDIILDSQFKLSADEHTGAGYAKNFFTLLTLFLLEPAFWYDIDYTLEGSAIILKEGKRVGQVNAQSEATVSAKLLSLDDLGKISVEALEKAKQSLYYQMIRNVQ